MRVNISYSVELEEVLEKLWLLYRSEKEKLDIKMQEIDSKMLHRFTDEELGDVSKALQECRLAIASFDIKLGEISNILSGYYALKYSPDPSPGDSQTDEIKDKNE